MEHHFSTEELDCLIESGNLEQLYSLLKQSLSGKDKEEWGQRIVELFCKRMWKQLGHVDPRSLAIPFFLDDLSTFGGGFLKLLAPGHLTLVISFIGELVDMLNVQNASSSGTNYNLYQALLSVNIIINWLTKFSQVIHKWFLDKSGSNGEGEKIGILKGEFDDLPIEKQNIILNRIKKLPPLADDPPKR